MPAAPLSRAVEDHASSATTCRRCPAWPCRPTPAADGADPAPSPRRAWTAASLAVPASTTMPFHSPDR